MRPFNWLRALSFMELSFLGVASARLREPSCRGLHGQAESGAGLQRQPLHVTGSAAIHGAEVHVHVAVARREDPAMARGVKADDLDLAIAEREVNLGLLVA